MGVGGGLVAKSCPTLVISWTIAHQAPLSVGDSPGKNTRVGHHALLQGVFPTQGLNPCFLGLLLWHPGSLPPGPSWEAHVCTLFQLKI